MALSQDCGYYEHIVQNMEKYMGGTEIARNKVGCEVADVRIRPPVSTLKTL